MTNDKSIPPDIIIAELAVPEVAIEEEVVAIQENSVNNLECLIEPSPSNHDQDINGDSEDLPAISKPIKTKKKVLFDTVTIYHFSRSQGFGSIPSQGGSTLGMTRRHFMRRKLSVDMFEEVRRRSRREILMKIKLEKVHRTRRHVAVGGVKLDAGGSNPPSPSSGSKSSASSSTSSSPTSSSASSSATSSSTSSSSSNSDSDSSFSYSDNSDTSDSDMEIDIFCQPIGVNLRRSLLRNSGVLSIDPKERRECDVIRDSRGRSGCKCVNQCIPNLCECSLLGVNCHVDRISYPCGCISTGCQNPQGRTEFDKKRVKEHLSQTLFRVGIG